MFILASAGLAAWADDSPRPAGKPPLAQATVDGVQAVALVTTDTDWRAKWENRAKVPAKFGMTHSLRPGQPATLLVLLKEEAASHVLTCGLTVLAGNRVAAAIPPEPCFKRPAAATGAIRLSDFTYRLGHEETADGETLRLDVVVSDSAGLRIPLEVTLGIAAAQE